MKLQYVIQMQGFPICFFLITGIFYFYFFTSKQIIKLLGVHSGGISFHMYFIVVPAIPLAL